MRPADAQVQIQQDSPRPQKSKIDSTDASQTPAETVISEDEYLRKLTEIVFSLKGVVKKVPIILSSYGLLLILMAWWPVVRSSGTYTVTIAFSLASLSNCVLLRLFMNQSTLRSSSPGGSKTPPTPSRGSHKPSNVA